MKNNTKKFKKYFTCLTVFLLAIILMQTNVYAGCQSSGGYSYCAYDGGTVNTTVPIYESQTYHTKGYQTTIGVSYSVTDTASATGSLSYGLSSWGVSVAGTIGVTTSEACTTSTNITFTVPSTTASGYYRINVVFPGKKVNFYTFTSEGTLISSRTVSYAPSENSAYRVLSNYA